MDTNGTRSKIKCLFFLDLPSFDIRVYCFQRLKEFDTLPDLNLASHSGTSGLRDYLI